MTPKEYVQNELRTESLSPKVKEQKLIDTHAVHTQMMLDQDDIRIAALTAENAELRKDARRIKWLDGGFWQGKVSFLLRRYDDYDSIVCAIDAATESDAGANP